MNLYMVRHFIYGSLTPTILCRVLEARAFTEKPSRMRTSSVRVAFTLNEIL
jgi:hypothetical protein